MKMRPCGKGCGEEIGPNNVSGICAECKRGEITDGKRPSRPPRRYDLMARKCELCGKRPETHAKDCKWKPKSRGYWRTHSFKKTREAITEYRCDAGHDFTSNLSRQKAKCPYCLSVVIVWQGESWMPERIVGTMPGIGRGGTRKTAPENSSITSQRAIRRKDGSDDAGGNQDRPGASQGVAAHSKPSRT